MFHRNFPALPSFLQRLRSCLASFVGPRGADEWEPLYANDPRFQDENYEVVFATTRSVN